MAIATSQYIKINKLYGMKEGSTNLSAAKAVYGGSTFSKRVWKGDEIVYDVWDTTLSAYNFEIPATGGNVEDYVEIISKMTSVEGENENISYSLNINNISSNTTTTSKTHNIVITQDLTGESITITCTQEANGQLSVSYSTPTVVDTSIEMIEASGGSTMLLVQYSQVKTTYYANGTSSSETITGTTVAENIKGIVGASGASTDGTYVEIGSAEDNVYTSARTVYTITGYTIEVNGESKTVTGASIAVKQEANTVSYSSWSYNISATAGTKEFTAAPASVRATVNSTRSRTYTYTSGYNPSGNKETEDYGWTASITSATGNSVTSSGSAGDTTADINLGPNTSTTSAKTTTVTFKSAGNSSKTSAITFTQSKDSLASTTTDITAYNATAGQALASGGTIPISLTLKVVSTPVYTSGNVGTPTTTYPTATVTSFIGSAQNSSGAYKDTAGTKVVVKSAGTTEHSSVWTVYKITSVTGTYNGKSYTWSGTLNIQQEANIIENYTYSDYTLNLTSNITTVNPISNPNVYISVESYRIKAPIYTSGEYGTGTKESLNATLSTSYGTLSKTSVSNGDTVQFTPNENTENNDRTITVNGKLTNYTSITDSISFTQVAAIYEFKVSPLSATFDFSGGTKEFIAITTRNENVTDKPTVSSNNSAFTVESITLNDVLMDRYNIVIRASLNGGSTTRYGTISVTQPGSGEVQEISVSQSAKPSSGGGTGGGGTSDVTANVEEAYWQNSTTIYYNVSFEGIDTYLDSVTIELSDDAYGGGTTYASTSHKTILAIDNVSGTLNIYDNVAPLYIVVKDNSGKVIGSGIVE